MGIAPGIVGSARTSFDDQVLLRALPDRVLARFDATHVTQNRSPFNPDAPLHTNNCALASIVMGLRELGRELVPGAAVQDQVEHAAWLATGDRAPFASTFAQRTRIFDALDVHPRTSSDIDELLAPGLDRVVVLSGHAGGSGTWYDRYGGDVLRRDGHHAVLAVAPEDGSHGWFVHDPNYFDPNSISGAIPTDHHELRTFFETASAYPNADRSAVDVTSVILR